MGSKTVDKHRSIKMGMKIKMSKINIFNKKKAETQSEKNKRPNLTYFDVKNVRNGCTKSLKCQSAILKICQVNPNIIWRKK